MQLYLIYFIRVKVVLILVLLVNVGCSVRLTPQFDQTIVDNLSEATKLTFILISSVSNGSQSVDYIKREDNYNKVLGVLEAMKLQINTRPIPNNKTVKKMLAKMNAQLSRKGLSPVTEIKPSYNAIDEIISNLEKMKDTDRSQGLTKLEVSAFKGNIVLYFDQAFTYEMFLQK